MGITEQMHSHFCPYIYLLYFGKIEIFLKIRTLYQGLSQDKKR